MADAGGRPASPHLRGGYATTCVAHTWKEPQQHPERAPRSMGDADRRTNTQPLPPKGAIPRCAPRRLCASRVPAVPVPAHWVLPAGASWGRPQINSLRPNPCLGLIPMGTPKASKNNNSSRIMAPSPTQLRSDCSTVLLPAYFSGTERMGCDKQLDKA